MDYKSFLCLVRLGIGHNAEFKDETIDWDEIQSLSEQQGVSAVVLDGMERLRGSSTCGVDVKMPEKKVLAPWIGRMIQGYEFRYEQYIRAIAEMAAFFSNHQVKMMILKGYACSLNWPRPEHRPCGDIDIWQFGMQKKADELLKREMGIVVNASEHHHTVFHWRDFLVENHYDLLIASAVKTNRQLEPILKELAMDDANYTDVYGERVYLPSANFNALFLLRHMLMHFVAVGISVRVLLDWAFFWEKHGQAVDLKWYDGVLEKYNMSIFFNVINAICVEDLGFDESIFPSVCSSPRLKERVLDDIMCPQYDKKNAHQPGFLSRIHYKYKRWKGGTWKREMCFSESSWACFWQSVWSHLLKPSSI